MQENPLLVGDAEADRPVALGASIRAHSELGVDDRLAEREKWLQHFGVAVLDPRVAVAVKADQVEAIPVHLLPDQRGVGERAVVDVSDRCACAAEEVVETVVGAAVSRFHSGERLAGTGGEVVARHDAVHEDRQLAAEDKDDTVGVMLAQPLGPLGGRNVIAERLIEGLTP